MEYFNSSSIDTERLLGFMSAFYTVTGQRTGLFDRDGKILLEYPREHSPFCSLIRESTEGRRRCEASDSYGIENARRLKHRFEYRCHSGLLEICEPIFDRSDIVGYIIFGQIIYDRNADSQLESISACCAGLPQNTSAAASLFPTIRRVDNDYIDAVLRLLEACVGYVRLEHHIPGSRYGLRTRLEAYISQHFGEDLRVTRIAGELSVSVSTLERCVKDNSGMTVNRLIRVARMKAAVKYLRDTSYPITEISALCGVPDYNYFSRIFKLEYGITPSEFRSSGR